MRDAVVRFFMLYGTHNGDLVVAPRGAGDTGAVCSAATPPITADENAASEGLARGERHLRARSADILRNNGLSRQMRDIWRSGHGREECTAQVSVFDHIPHRAFFDFRMIKMHHPRAWPFTGPPICYFDFAHGLRLRVDGGPHTDAAQKPYGCKRKRVGAAIKGRVFTRSQRERIDDRDGEASLRCGEGECGAVQAAADDKKILIHTLQYALGRGIVHAPRRRYAGQNEGADMQDWLWMTAADLGQGIGAGHIDPKALTETYLAAIDAHPLRDRIYARVTQARARSEAQAAADRAASGLRRGPLDGVPISWKDLFDTAGTATEAGTKLMEGRVPDTDAAVLQNATAAGLVCLGKTHMSEIAFSGLGLNPMTGTPPCVNDPGAVAGGSSSGAAASVAFGLAAAAVGSDTGGSVRIPSAWNDLVGFKPAHGALSLRGVVPLCATFDTVGPLCRSVADAALLTAALGGAAAPDLGGASLAGVRLMVLKTVAMDDVRANPAAAFDDAMSRLQAAGALIDEGDFPPLHDAFDLAGVLYGADSYGWWRTRVEAAPDKMYPQILERVRGGRHVSGADFANGWTQLRALRTAYRAATAGYDAVIMPTAPTLPPQIERLLTDEGYYKSENLLALRNTRVANLMGLTSLSLPTLTPSCGVLLNMQAGEEARLLRLGTAAAPVLRPA